MRYRLRNFAVFMSLNLLAGCTLGPDYEPPHMDIPNLNADEKIAEFTSARWWSVFKDSTLNKLEEQALKHNSDLEQAAANIEIAEAASGMAFADLWPSIGGSVEGKETFMSAKGRMYFPGLMKRDMWDYLGAISISYELDFWGKYRNANRAAGASLLSAKAGQETLLLTITSEVAKTYFMIRALDAKLAIARRTLKARQEACDVYRNRFKNGYCTELDCLRIDSEMSSVKMTVLDLELALGKAETALGVLIGASPREMIGQKKLKDKGIEKLRIPCSIPKGIPSDILARRPDILQAEGQLMAANAKIGEARAAYFPSISLTGAFGSEAVSLRDLFSGGSDTWNLGGRISLPILIGGKTCAGEDAAEANYRKAEAIYRKTVQTAFKETLDALASNRKNREIVASGTRRVNALKKSYSLAKKQKEFGLIGLLDLLDVERGLLTAEMELVGALQNRLNAVVNLCKALGGGWHVSVPKLRRKYR